MIGKICEVVTNAPRGKQLKIGFPSGTEDGSFVLVTHDLGSGFFYALSEKGQLLLVCNEYLQICQSTKTSEG